MKYRLKPLSEQVMVITGASSGIGLTTARLAAQRGVRLVLAARNAEALEQVSAQMADHGHVVLHVVADVARMEDVRRIADVARVSFGGIDSWVNNAGVSIYGQLDEVLMTDLRRLFDINFWGVVHGSLVALGEMRERGGAIINVGSEASDVALPLQGMYAASKHAVKGFTDSLRVEVEAAGLPVAVTLVKPAAIDTMFTAHARNYMEVEPKLPPPIYAPETVAEAILYAAAHFKRDIYVGGASKFFSASNRLLPRLIDKYLERFMFRQQRSDRPADSDGVHSALYAPGIGKRERLGYPGHVCESSLYTRLTTGFGR